MERFDNRTARTVFRAFQPAPVVTIVAGIAVANWMLCALVAIVIGGDALGTIPTEDQFVVTSHGIDTGVSETTWIFSLVYSYLTIGFTPVVVISVTAYHLLRAIPPLGRWIATSLACLPAVGWLYLVSHGTLNSILAYIELAGT